MKSLPSVSSEPKGKNNRALEARCYRELMRELSTICSISFNPINHLNFPGTGGPPPAAGRITRSSQGWTARPERKWSVWFSREKCRGSGRERAI